MAEQKAVDLDNGLAIHELAINDFMGIKVARIVFPDEPLTLISGPNGAGKTSIKCAVDAVLAGIFPEEAIRKGATKSKVFLTLRHAVVDAKHPDAVYACELNTTKSGTRLDVREVATGEKIKNPRAWLTERFAAQGCDPLAFAMMPPREQVEILKRVTGLGDKFADIEKRKAEALQNHRDAKRSQELAEAQVAANPDIKGPDELVSTAALAESLRAGVETNAANGERRKRLDKAKGKIEELRTKIAELQKQLNDGGLWVEQEDVEVAKLADVDTNKISEEIRNAERTNEAVRRRGARRTALKELEKSIANEQKAAGEVKDLDAERATALADTKLPVEGLAFTEEGVTYNGIPIRQVNSASQIRIGIGLALAEKKQIRTLYTEYGSLLDANGRREYAAQALAHKAQAFLEVAADKPGDGPCIFIEDGTVKEGGGA